MNADGADTAHTLHFNCPVNTLKPVCLRDAAWCVFRIGLVFVVSDDDDIDGMQDAGVALVRAYNYISDEVDSQSAFEAVISVSRPSANAGEELVKTPAVT